MFRAAPRLIARSALPRNFSSARRYISTAPPTQKSRSWKSLVARFGIAGTLIYYYNNTDVFAEEPRHPISALPETETESEHLPTIESLSAERQQRKAVQAQLDAQAQQNPQSPPQDAPQSEGGMDGLQGEADQQGAFNPETGEINWDCPCLGGMATGPCGEQFKAAFSCFVHSTEEPKGMDCIDKFKDMQNCFREYPEVYGSELEGDEDENEDSSAAAPAQEEQREGSAPERGYTAESSANVARDKSTLSTEPSSSPASSAQSPPQSNLGLVPDSYRPEAKRPEPLSESEKLVPKAAHDAVERK